MLGDGFHLDGGAGHVLQQLVRVRLLPERPELDQSEPASRRWNQSVPNSSRMKLVICAAKAQARRYDVT